MLKIVPRENSQSERELTAKSVRDRSGQRKPPTSSISNRPVWLVWGTGLTGLTQTRAMASFWERGIYTPWLHPFVGADAFPLRTHLRALWALRESSPTYLCESWLIQVESFELGWVDPFLESHLSKRDWALAIEQLRLCRPTQLKHLLLLEHRLLDG